MSSITNINNNSSVVNVGRTTPVSPGPQTADRSIPVVMATDQTAIPVEEQNKVQSEVALSLLGIPRAEVALGIFADVNTYDVNPSEWSMKPEFHINGDGVKHLPTEAGALVEATRNNVSVLTSKRFFRYQPGRVSAATFGVKSTTSVAHFAQNPVIRKFGIYDKYDGYYWETRNSGLEDNFSVVRRTQSVANYPVSPYGVAGATPLRGESSTVQFVPTTQLDDYRCVGYGQSESEVSEGSFVSDRKVLTENRYEIIDNVLGYVVANYTTSGAQTTTDGGAYTATGSYYNDLSLALAADGVTLSAGEVEAKCKRDLDYWMDNYILDLKHDSTAHTQLNRTNFALSDGSGDWDATGVGLFPKIQHFEEPVHKAIREVFTDGQLYNTNNSDVVTNPTGDSLGLTAPGITKLIALSTITYEGFDDGSGVFDAGNPTEALIKSTTGTSFGDKDPLETFFDVKKNFWAYYVTTKKIDTTTSVVYADPGAGPSSALGATSQERKTNIRYKCQRDVGYIIDGFKNDILGGGNAETTYNASMFVRGTGLSVYSQEDGGSLSEPLRHEHLRLRIQNDLKTYGYPALSDQYVKLTSLSNKIIDNFGRENIQSMQTGKRGFAGNLVAMRDGLLHVHAGAYDPSLLKDPKKTKAKVTAETTAASTFSLTEGIVTFGQHVKISWKGSASDITLNNGVDVDKNQVLLVKTVYGPKGNEFTLVVPNTSPEEVISFSQADINTADTIYIDTVVPFIFPKDYDVENLNGYESSIDTTPGTVTLDASSPGDASTHRVLNTKDSTWDIQNIPRGAVFPYMYAKDDNLTGTFYADNEYAGFVNTAIQPTGNSNLDLNIIRSQIDNVNFFPEYVNWVKNNVKPEYYGVYEYRVPRSRFSHDSLDGIDPSVEGAPLKTAGAKGVRNRVYSDLATGVAGTVRPGENYVINVGQPEKQSSLYDFDFTKVTMLKVEFSWYGAVGALFLAYVPVGNGEARWVRVHHLRASNQLKIASLGNATLPITYTTYGGGDRYALGDLEDQAGNSVEQGYGNISHNIVKYGASYYIDGGDRGTVRLYSYNNDAQVNTYGKQFAVTTPNYSATSTIDGEVVPSISVDATDDNGAVIDPTFYMGGTVVTSNRLDQNIKIVWVDNTDASASNWKAYLSAPFQSASPSGVKILPDRAATVYGLETKKVILSTREGNAVRNRVQVYPTKLSTSNGSADNTVRLRFKKTPLFQSLYTQTSTAIYLGDEFVIGSVKTPLPVDNANMNSAIANNGEHLYGWFRGRINSDSVTVFGKLYKEADELYFELLESYEGTVVLKSGSANYFIRDLRFTADGDLLDTTATKNTGEIEGLSSLKIATDPCVPIPNTGINVATIYLQKGTEQFDLATYFDYNKEYLSFPLTDIADSLYFAVDSDTAHNSAVDPVSLGVTWEEQ